MNRRLDRRLAEIDADLRTLGDDDDVVLGRAMAALRELSGAKLAFGFSPCRTLSGYDIDFVLGDRADDWGEFARAFLPQVQDGWWSVFHIDRPEPAQRNRVHVFPWQLKLDAANGDRLLKRHRPILRRAGLDDKTIEKSAPKLGDQAILEARLGCADLHHLRTLVCDGPALLARIGCAFEEEPPPQATSVLQRLVPALRTRLQLRRVARQGSPSGLGRLLELLGAPVLVVGRRGMLLDANAAGKELLGDDLARRAALAALRSGDNGSFVRVPVEQRGVSARYLLIGRAAPTDLAARLQAARVAWGLTPREVQVLGVVVQGKPNKTVATLLGCAESTVEFHLTSLFGKAGVDNRAELVACFYRLGPP